MFDVSPFIPKFVRHHHAHNPSPQIPFKSTQFGVILMADVCGFSQLASIATERGDKGAEGLALEMSSYMDKAIKIIEHYNGDCVKFLGDAVLVCFQPNSSDLAALGYSAGSPPLENDEKLKVLLVKRAVDCGLELLSRLSTYRVYLTPGERSRHRPAEQSSTSGTETPGQSSKRFSIDNPLVVPTRQIVDESSWSMDAANCWAFLKRKKSEQTIMTGRRRGSVNSDTPSKDSTAVDLELHIAVAAGKVTNVLLGVLGEAKNLEDLVNKDKAGSGRLEYAVCGEAVESLEEGLAIAKEGEMTLTRAAWSLLGNPNHLDISYEQRRNCIVIRNGKGSKHNSRRKPPKDDLMITRRDSDVMLDITSGTNLNALKYINKSALYRLCNSEEGSYPALFRDATIMFVSLGDCKVESDIGYITAQQALSMALGVLDKYEGLLQQFAVDDKGATILAVFGLPYPWSHEKEATFAAKAAVELRKLYLELGINDFAISLASGVIFNGVMGNNYRKDNLISGEAIVTAVRLIKFEFSRQNVICDSDTKTRVEQFCEFQDMGENYVKGKSSAIQMWKIVKFGTERHNHAVVDTSSGEFIGYSHEMTGATRFIDSWINAKNQHLLVVTGASGVGKSYFATTLEKTYHMDMDICVFTSQATEVEKGTKYYVFKEVLLQLFEVIVQDYIPELEQGAPQNTTRDDDSISITPSITPSVQVQRSVDWYKNFTYKAMFQKNNELSNDLLDLVLQCLHKCGEDVKTAPLMKGVFPFLDIEENSFTSKLDAQSRDIILTSIVMRMIRYVSDHVNLMIACDDVHWADYGSITWLREIHETCPRTFLFLVSRPIKDYNVTFIDEIMTTGTILDITLKGLNATEMEKIIVQAFKRRINSVNPEILRVMQARTGGNPLYVKNMAIVLKDMAFVTVVQGELVPSKSTFDLEDLLCNFDYDRIVKMQFDRLNASFQEFLKVASCLDQTFFLGEIRAVISPNNIIFENSDPEKINEMIKKLDIYNFLSAEKDNVAGDKPSNELVYSFAQTTIPMSLNGMIPFETRLQYHNKLARYYEEQLKNSNAARLLVKIARHYLETDNVEKQLFFLEKLAEHHMASNFLPEATSSLEKIVNILNDNADIAKDFGRMHRSDIYSRLGECLAMRTKLHECERYLIQALEYLDTPWPAGPVEFTGNMIKQRTIQKYHRKLFEWGHSPKEAIGRHSAIIERQIRIIYHLTHAWYYLGKGRYFVLGCMWGVNACEKLGTKSPSYPLFLSWLALVCWLNDKKNDSIWYIKRALDEVEYGSDAMTFTVLGSLCFASGKWGSACDLAYKAIDSTNTLGVITDCQGFYRAVGLLLTIRIFDGTLSTRQADLNWMKQMAETARRNGDYEAEVWLSVYQVANAIVTDNLRNVEPYIVLLEGHLREAHLLNKVAMHGVLMAYYSRLGHYSVARKHFVNLTELMPMLTVTANIFPIFGLIFCTMALYDISEAGVFVAAATVDAKYFDRFITHIYALNQGFQQVKFWEFCQPCLYLARALPYLGTGRLVEGYMVLRHGLMEMHFIDEIRFLKAYYWAKLGKYANLPEDRVDWTQRARAEYISLGIAGDVYLNPDPESNENVSRRDSHV